MNRITLLIIPLFIFGCCNPKNETTFSVIGDMPYGLDDEQKIVDIISHQNIDMDSDFMVHVGDIKEGDDPCDFYYYSRFQEIIKESMIPVYAIPGDNEWTDCDNQEESYETWEQLLSYNLDGHFGVTPERLNAYPSSFAFVKNKILFIGLTLPDADIDDYSNIEEVLMYNNFWLKRHAKRHMGKVDMAVIFAHCKPTNEFNYRNDMIGICEHYFKGKKVLWIQGDDHDFEIKKNWKGSNIDRITVSQDERLLITASGGNYKINN